MGYQYYGGLELANLLVTSDPLHQSWDAIAKQKPNTEDPNSLYINKTQESNCTTIITFGASSKCLQNPQGLVSSSTLKDFEFLCSKKNPSFSINEAVVRVFDRHREKLSRLKQELVQMAERKDSVSLIIITGQSMGGCVATLFTLWLLEDLNLLKAKRPLCITFGSPFIGDEHLRQSVLEFSTWGSCFLHVASTQDPVASELFLSQATSVYKPFGTFLLCSASGSACFEDADSILQLLVATKSHSAAQNLDPSFDYGQTLKHLKLKALCKEVSKLVEPEIDPIKAAVITLLIAVGVVLTQQQQPNIDIEKMKSRMEKHHTKIAIQKKKASEASRKLNDMKIYMAYMEWYKKESKDFKIGYYDRYKNQRFPSDVKVNEYKKKLSNFWEDVVAELENKPHKEGATFRTRYLMGGTNYRRMIEPLHIAEYYSNNGAAKNYQTEKRHRHFSLLEQWLKEEEKPENEAKPEARKQNVSSCLTDDSCFWAHVEEALISCNVLKNQGSSNEEKESSKLKLKEFEDYVLEALKNYAVTPDIFLSESTFMTWWKEYQGIVGGAWNPTLTQIMKPDTHQKYVMGGL